LVDLSVGSHFTASGAVVPGHGVAETGFPVLTPVSRRRDQPCWSAKQGADWTPRSAVRRPPDSALIRGGQWCGSHRVLC
jgi:hypothetical protein